MSDKLKTNKLSYKLGDIIKIIAPTDPAIDGRVYLINYYDTEKIRLDEPNGDDIVLTLTDGYLDNKSIESIVIKSRATEEGYARQNNLLTGIWIDINFGGDLPLTFTGQITNLVEDKIEITTHPDKDVIFIDFAYKGLPEDLQISNIKIRRAPVDVIKTGVPPPNDGQRVLPGVPQGVSPPHDELGEAGFERAEPFGVSLPHDELGEAGFKRAEPFAEPFGFERAEPFDQLRTLILNADQIMFGEDLEPVKHMIDVPIEEQRYDIENQLEDLLDNMLSTIPNAERTDLVKNNIHKMIQRFKQLREKFSIFDDNGYALMPKVQGAKYKPLINVMEKLDKQLYWMMPVVKIIKKIYTIEAVNEEEEEEEISVEDDATVLSFFENYNEETAIIDQYEKNDTAGDLNKYAFLQRRLNPYLTPYKQVESKDDIILDTTVNSNIMAIVDNLGKFKSTVNGTDTITLDSRYNKLKHKIDKKRFLTQNYITGTTGLEMIKVRGDNPLIKRKNLTPNDEISIKSLITLQEPTVRFSRINLYSTNILDKANLNLHFLNYWQLLKAKTRVSTTNVTDISKPYNHDPDTFLTKVKHFTIAEDLLDKDDEKETYNKFLDTVIPQTKFLFNLIKPYLTGKLSINDILTYLEPFMVYHEDLTFMQYKEMNDYIRDKIYEYQKNFLTKARKYGNIKGTQTVAIPSMIKILDENANLKTKVLDVYGFTDTITQMTNAEFIKRINEFDTGIFYNNAVALASTNLMIAEGSRNMADINIYLNADKAAAAAAAAAAATATGKKQTAKSKMLAQTQGIVGDSTCNKIKVIAKRYIELEELNEDNGKESFFDKKYDTTDYSVSKADSNMPVEEQLTYYTERLIKNKGLDEISARREAEALIKGKRTIEDGDYAILETTDENSATIQYYVRQNDAWKLDDSIDSETFADNTSLFCNLNEKCIAVKETCQDQQTGANELKKHNLKLLLSEFDSNLNANKDIVMNRIDDEIVKADARIELLKGMRIRDLYKYETAKIALGNTLETVEKMTSPNDGLLQTILGQADTAKRYLDIINFVKYFTRLGLIDSGESPFWFYCTKTNKQMLPTFIHKLAVTYTTNKAAYIRMLDTICAEQGTLSEDGDKWIDKHSGYTIKMTELSADEEYTAEGFKVVSHAVQEADAGDIILQAAAEQKMNKTAAATMRKFSTMDATKIYNVIESMSTNIGINIDAQTDFIVRNVLNLITNENVMAPKARYEKFVQMNAAKGKEVDSYENAYNSKLIYLTLAYFLIAIQISIPPIKTRTTYPGCKKSFSGFPIDDVTDNKKGITYIGCVAHKIKSNPNLPWSAIGKKNAQFIITQMEALITTFILPTDEYKNGVKEFKQYLEENPEVSDIPDEHNVSNWTNFLPPLKPLKMKLPQDVGEVFKTHLKDSLRKGSATQHDYILELQSKILMFSFSIIELVEKTVHGEGVILKSNSGEPFVENACCESSTAKTLQYFINKTPDIATYNNKVVNLSDMLDDTIRMSKASILFDPSNTKRKLTELSNTFSEETIYRAFIEYCKFNSLLPLSDNLKAVCSTKPDNFDASDSISESIRKLKSNSRNYNENSLAKLLDVINNSTKQTIEPIDKQLNNVSKLSEIMERIDRENIRPSNFRADFIAVLEEFEMNALMEDTKQLRKLKNLLGSLNASMQKDLFDFVSKNSLKVKKDEQRKFRDCLEKIVLFKETGDNLFLGKKDETGYKMINFMKKTMRCLTKEFPNMIINGVDYEEYVKVPMHWKLSDYHRNDVKGIIKNYYADLKTFYKDDQIALLLKKFTDGSLDINELAQNTLFYAPIEIIGNGKQAQAKQTQAKQTQAKQTQAKQTQAKEQTQAQEQTQTNKEKSLSPLQPTEPTHKYSAFDLDLNVYLFKFYFLSILTDLMALKDDEEILQLPLSSSEDSSLSAEDLLFASSANADVLEGNKVELSEKIVTLIVTFTNLIGDDKKTVDYNYDSLMEVLLRSKVKEKDEITDYLGKMTVEERDVENLFKNNKLGRWSKGEQKGVHTYDTKTYDQEREDMEKMALNEARLNKRCAVTDLNRDIYALEMLEEDAINEDADREDNMINYMGEDAEPEEYEMDGDENYY